VDIRVGEIAGEAIGAAVLLRRLWCFFLFVLRDSLFFLAFYPLFLVFCQRGFFPPTNGLGMKALSLFLMLSIVPRRTVP